MTGTISNLEQKILIEKTCTKDNMEEKDEQILGIYQERFCS